MYHTAYIDKKSNKLIITPQALTFEEAVKRGRTLKFLNRSQKTAIGFYTLDQGYAKALAKELTMSGNTSLDIPISMKTFGDYYSHYHPGSHVIHIWFGTTFK